MSSEFQNQIEHLKHDELADIPHMNILGRTTGRRSPLTLFWTGSGLEWQAKGSELWVEVESDYSTLEPWVSVVINGCPVSRQMVVRGRQWLCLFRGMNRDRVKHVRLVKDTQAMSGDPACMLNIHAVRFDGEFLPVPKRDFKLEFIGDSITSGEGAIGATTEEDWIPMWFSGIHNYAALTAEALHADFRILSQSGWGVLTSWDNDPACNMPQYYEQVCGLLTGEKHKALGADEHHDFAAWQPDVIVVNLGTNDGNAYQTTGRSSQYLEAFESAIQHFLAKLRRYNPKAHIVWVYGMLGLVMMPAICRAVDRYQRASGDQRVSVFQLPSTNPDTVGARMHPGRLAHEKAAAQLAPYLKKLLG